MRDWLLNRATAIRRNHGIEHATVQVLLDRHGAARMAGRAAADGFYLLAACDEDELLSCAEEALDRMQQGERGLAVSPLCGTNLVVTGLFTSTATIVALRGGSLRQQFGNAVTAAMLGAIAAQPAGRWLQQHITTSGDVDALEIAGVRTIAGPLMKVDTRTAPTPSASTAPPVSAAPPAEAGSEG